MIHNTVYLKRSTTFTCWNVPYGLVIIKPFFNIFQKKVVTYGYEIIDINCTIIGYGSSVVLIVFTKI